MAPAWPPPRVEPGGPHPREAEPPPRPPDDPPGPGWPTSLPPAEGFETIGVQDGMT